MTIKTLDLFSCIAGHALGLHAAGNFKTVQFVEVNEYRQRVIAKHFPGTPIHGDITTYQGKRGEADLIIGGPPCQQTSVASAIHGKRTGVSLWPEMRRVISNVESSWVIVEQPPGNRTWEDTVTGDLEEFGYATTRLVLAASDFGAPHQRRRVFLLANRDLSRLEIARSSGPSTIASLARGAADGNPWSSGVPRGLRVSDGVPGRMDRRERIEALGDSNPPIMMTALGLMISAAERVSKAA